MLQLLTYVFQMITHGMNAIIVTAQFITKLYNVFLLLLYL